MPSQNLSRSSAAAARRAGRVRLLAPADLGVQRALDARAVHALAQALHRADHLRGVRVRVSTARA